MMWETIRRVAVPVTCALGLAACTDGLIVEPVIVSDDIYASRSFAGPNDFPPEMFKGYGILAFRKMPSQARGQMFCEAYVAGLATVEIYERTDIGKAQQMVTVWPLRDAEEAAELQVSEDSPSEICARAVANYNLATAETAVRDARKAVPRGVGSGALDRRGPYLLAWAPAEQKGKRDALVLVSDLSDVTTPAQAEAEILRWKTEIVERPELWANGWSQERLRVTIQRWADRNAQSILSFLGIEA